MKLVKEIWSISELIEKKKTIDPKPQYQRTAVWTADRKSFLIDSILRGYDIPKFYFKFYDKKNSKGYEFEIADGQQRIRAIWDFYEDVYPLKKKTIIDGEELSSLKYSQLPNKFKMAFQDYELNISTILSNDTGEVNDLFTRLQKGVSLNPPELRHAIVSNIGEYIDKYVVQQQESGFFKKDCKILDKRFKHQDYIDHIIALVHYNNTKDLKAATMAQLYIDFVDKEKESFLKYFEIASQVLKTMITINSHKKGIFKNKWSFVDAFWLLYQNDSKLQKINSKQFCNRFIEFDEERKKYNSNPEKILEIKDHKFGENLYHYIQAFNKEGANKENIKKRADIFSIVFNSLFPI